MHTNEAIQVEVGLERAPDKTSRVVSHNMKYIPGPLFTTREDVLPQDLVKSLNCEIRV